MRSRLKWLLLLVSLPILVWAGFYSCVMILMANAAKDGQVAAESVYAQTANGQIVRLKPLTRIHYKGEHLSGGHKVMEIRIEEGSLKGSVVLVPEQYFRSIVLNGRNAAL